MQKAKKKNEKEKEWITMLPAHKKKKKRETLPLFLRHKKSGSLVS